jgi:hypothetical protein
MVTSSASALARTRLRVKVTASSVVLAPVGGLLGVTSGAFLPRVELGKALTPVSARPESEQRDLMVNHSLPPPHYLFPHPVLLPLLNQT